MVSTLKLTKIQIPNSDSDVISLDASTGNITLNKTLGGTSVIIQGEGTATTNLQQGLIKGWIRFDGTGTIAIDDSFNYASITDNGTGNYTATLSNPMNNILYAPVAGAGDVNYGAKIDLEADVTNTTTACRLRTAGTTSGTGDTDLVAIHIAGDLA